jgi:nitrogen fixation/metabolism regulation signal transduction histidine kinase
MKRRLSLVLAGLGTAIAMLALAVPAFAASDDGEGLVGETDDKIVTFVSLGVLLFFILVVVLGTVIQSRLEKRKDAAKDARLRSRIGW